MRRAVETKPQKERGAGTPEAGAEKVIPPPTFSVRKSALTDVLRGSQEAWRPC